jgi:hypothetical protein
MVLSRSMVHSLNMILSATLVHSALEDYLAFPDAENLGTAHRACPPCGGPPVLEGNLFRILYLSLLSALHTVRFHVCLLSTFDASGSLFSNGALIERDSLQYRVAFKLHGSLPQNGAL